MCICLQESWVVDAATMDDETIVVAASDSSLHLLHSTEESQHPLLALTQLPAMPSCLFIRPSGAGHYIVVGDEAGVVHVINLVSVNALTASSAAGQPLTELPWQELCAQTTVTRLSGKHSQAVGSVELDVSSATVISCSQDPKASVVLQGLDQASPGYSFSIHKGVCTFALDWGLHVLVTGSRDGSVRLWNPYVPSAPLAVLTDHDANVVHVLISASSNAVLALAADKVLRVWNVDTYKCLQTIEFDFPSPSSKTTPNDASSSNTDLGPRPLTLLSCGTLLVTCKDYLASLGPSDSSDETPRRKTKGTGMVAGNGERSLSPKVDDLSRTGDATTASFADLKNESITTDAKERERMKDLISQGSPFCCLKLFHVPPLNVSKDLPTDINIKGPVGDLLRSHAAASRALSRSLSSATFQGRSSRAFQRGRSRPRARNRKDKSRSRLLNPE
ncbi:cilia- and flagella-associated protein 337-like [Oratosquilla oratoria]|uniref:cilia- and flagella-associated protein 337-like n=1 Tax=Oratosquilla oratoria TaxID=337810 RepID=UPI003F76788C